MLSAFHVVMSSHFQLLSLICHWPYSLLHYCNSLQIWQTLVPQEWPANLAELHSWFSGTHPRQGVSNHPISTGTSFWIRILHETGKGAIRVRADSDHSFQMMTWTALLSSSSSQIFSSQCFLWYKHQPYCIGCHCSGNSILTIMLSLKLCFLKP